MQQFNEKQTQQKAKSQSPKDSNEIALRTEKQKTIQSQNKARKSANAENNFTNLNYPTEESSSFQPSSVPSSVQSKKYKRGRKQKVIKLYLEFKLGRT